MLNELWDKFKARGLSGSVSVRCVTETESVKFAIKSDSAEDDGSIHESIYNMDPEYAAVCIIKSGAIGNPKDLPVVSFASILNGNDMEAQADALDDAILQGLGHRKALIMKETGYLVKFGYKADELV